MYYKDFFFLEIPNKPERFIKYKSRWETEEELFSRIKEWMRGEKISDGELINIETIYKSTIYGDRDIESKTKGFRLWVRE